jgi:hypothetical protein
MPAAQSVISPLKNSLITVKWLDTNKPVPDAVVKLGWGKACGDFTCRSYQKNGKTGAMGRITFKNLPTGNINWCAYASKGGSEGGYCFADHSRPIESAITVRMPK